MKSCCRGLAGAFAVAALILGYSDGQAQNAWPTGHVKIVVPFSPGIGMDIVARGFAEVLSKETQQPFTVENRAGAGGASGTVAVANAAADGTTLLFTGHAPFAVSPYVLPEATYDPIKDFVPVTKVGSHPLVLITGSQSPIKSFDELVKLAKASPGKLDYATTGLGTPSHINFEALKADLGIDVRPIHYRNAGQAMTDVVSGRIPTYMPSLPAAQALLQDGKVRGLAIGSLKRSTVMPGIPTLAELLNQPTLEAGVWYGFFAPKNMSPALVDRIHSLVAKAAASDQVKEMFARIGAEQLLIAPPAFKQQVQEAADQSRKLLQIPSSKSGQ